MKGHGSQIILCQTQLFLESHNYLPSIVSLIDFNLTLSLFRGKTITSLRTTIMSTKALETVKVNIDHLTLKIETLEHCDRSEALLALEHAAASLSYSENKRVGQGAALSSYATAYLEQREPKSLSFNPGGGIDLSAVSSSLRDDKNNRHQCETCAKSFPTNFKLRRHLKTNHQHL